MKYTLKTARNFAAALITLGALSGVADSAVIGIGSNSWYTPTLANNLISQGHAVTVVSSYTTASLSAYDVYIQDGNSYFNSSALDDFVFNGGTLIQIPWSQDHNTSLSSNLKVMTQRTATFSGVNPTINVHDSANWLLNGVDLPSPGDYTSLFPIGNQFIAGSIQVLSWGDASNTSLLGYREYGDGLVVSFNQHLVTSDSMPINMDWSNQIIYNAVSVPEPSSYLLVTGGFLTMALRRKRKLAANPKDRFGR